MDPIVSGFLKMHDPSGGRHGEIDFRGGPDAEIGRQSPGIDKMVSRPDANESTAGGDLSKVQRLITTLDHFSAC